MTTHSDWVDDAVDLMLRVNPGVDEFTAQDLVPYFKIAGMTRSMASQWLQVHRRKQMLGRTRYVLNCRSYARAARWYIHAGPGRSTKAQQRLTLGHVDHIANDLRRRADSDLAAELSPATVQHPVVQVLLTGMEAQIVSAILGLVNGVNASLLLIEQTTGMTPDRRSVAP